MIRSLWLLCAMVLAAPSRAADADLLFPNFPNGENPARLHLEVVAEVHSPEEAWGAFLDSLFKYFDRDADGLLSPAEAKRVFPLPLPGGQEVGIDFKAVDTNRDGKASPAEFRAYYRAHGFTPVTLLVQPAPARVLALGESLFRHLDRDGDGTLSSSELERASALLERLDEDDDEVLTAAELLGGAADAPGLDPLGMKAASPENSSAEPAEATLRLRLSGKPTLAAGARPFRLSADASHLHVPGGTCLLAVEKDDPRVRFRAAKAFYIAQFKAAAGNEPALKAAFADDPTAQVLSGLFDAADRNGDGKLTRAELEAFFDLIELGITCRIIVTATDRGRNLFDAFDADGDGRLDLGELVRASRSLVTTLRQQKGLPRGKVPASYRLLVSREVGCDAFGPVPFGANANPKAPTARNRRGPKWFQAQDQNGDGFISPREFVGPPHLFAKLDADGDGRISVAEAEAAGR